MNRSNCICQSDFIFNQALIAELVTTTKYVGIEYESISPMTNQQTNIVSCIHHRQLVCFKI